MKTLFNFILLTLVSAFTLSAQTSQWQQTGPTDFPTNISGQINGIGRVCQIKFNPLNPNSMFACSASGGLWKSTNLGSSWHQLGTDGLPDMGIASVCVDYTDTNIIYIGSGDANYYSDHLGIWKTTNGGSSWTQVNNNIGTKMALELLMDPLNHLTLLAATSAGLWRTTDGGANWTNVLVGNQFTDMKWKPGTNTSIVYASSKTKFFRSIDRGISWTEITNGFSGLLALGTRLAVSDANPATVYVGSVFDEGTIFRSIDSGLNFSIQYHDTSRSLTGYDTTGNGQGNYNFCIEANPSNANQLFLGSHCIWRSNDGGVTWSKLTVWSKVVHTDMHDYVFQPNNTNNLYEANDGGVWLTSNAGVDWQQKSDGLVATENYHAAVSPLYTQLISAGTQDNGELIFTDGKWKTNRGGDWTTRMQMDYSVQKFVYYFDDKERRALPSGSGDAYNVPAIVSAGNLKHVFSPDNQEVGYLSGSGIWQSTNLSNANPVWTQIPIPTTTTIKSIAVCKNHPNILAYSVASKLYITHDVMSATPTFVNFPFPVSVSANDIIISGNDTNLIFVLLNNAVYRSTDGGQNFTNYTGTLPNISHLRIYLDEYSTNQSIYLGNTLGVYYRNSSMSDWDNYSGVLPTIASIKDFMYFNDGGTDARIYIAYYGRGVWESKLENSHTCVTPVISNAAMNGNKIAVNWNNTGSAQYDLQYRLKGETGWTQIAASTNSANITTYSGCSSYEIRVRTKCTGDSSLWSNKYFFDTPSDALTNDFDNHLDIGTVGAAGSVCYDDAHKRYTIYASGADIWDVNDQFHFLYKKMNGDVTISARVKHIGNIYGWAKGGVMIRETLSTDSKHDMCALTPGNGFANQWRTNTNDNSSNVDTAGKEPGWVMLERIGNTFTAYFSTDGSTWNAFNTTTINMSDTVYVGLANCSHIDSTINDAVFDHIVINGTGLGISETAVDETPFHIYPNPANDKINITFKDAQASAKIKILVHDMAGKTVLSKTKMNTSNSQELTISSLASGVYFLEVNADRRYVTRFVKE